MDKPHYNVIIATPGMDMDGGYVRSLTETIAELNKRNISNIWIGDHFSIVNLAREFTLDAGYLLDKDEIDYSAKGPIRDTVTYDKIFLIDSDISWTTDQFLKLYYSEKDIVSGLYMTVTGQPTVYPKDKESFAKKNLAVDDEIIEVTGFGLGFVCVKSGVFESLERPWFQFLYTDRYSPTPKTFMIGEDISWCMRVSELGYILYSDLGVKVKHCKKIFLG
jgi:hypothetical protein